MRRPVWPERYRPVCCILLQRPKRPPSRPAREALERFATSALEPPGRGIEKMTADAEAAVEDVAKQFLAREHPCERDGVSRHDRKPSFGAVGGRRKRVDRRNLEWKLDPPYSRKVDRKPEQIGAPGQRRKSPREGEREMVLIGWCDLLGEVEDGILEGEQDPRVHLEREVEIERTAATLFGMQVHLPGLAK